MKLAEIWLRPETALALPSSAVWHLERNNLYEKVLRKMGTDIGHPVRDHLPVSSGSYMRRGDGDPVPRDQT